MKTIGCLTQLNWFASYICAHRNTFNNYPVYYFKIYNHIISMYLYLNNY